MNERFIYSLDITIVEVKKLEIKRHITISLEKTKSHFIVHSNAALSMLLGTTSVSSNPHIFQVKKVRGGWTVPVEVVKERYVELKRRKADLDDKIAIMGQILGE